jgi:predicted nucleotide-binding protein (sugar kinase/HSP70/actin superfamily)
LIEKQEFDLDSLINRKVTYHKTFLCSGDESGCDRKCEINMIEVDNKKFPFGGACNKYYNLRFQIKADAEKNDLVTLRQKLVFEKYASIKLSEEKEKNAKTIGINKSFIMDTYYPLFYNFFTKLGLKVILSEEIKRKGIEKMNSSFCYPVEISHGLFQDLIDKNPDYIFLPHITEIHIKNEDFYKRTCVFVQAEPYYLKVAFSNEKLPEILSPVISFASGLESAEEYFLKIAKKLGFSKNEARFAYKFALEKQHELFEEFKNIGKNFLEEIKNQKKFAIVLFGRPYNSFAKEANLNIPHKFASRDRVVIPYDFLPIDDEKSYKHMYWATGNTILRVANLVKNNPLLFGCYITNFSCGPDSFIISYFREIMGQKPFLTLELDSHSADAGINTRIEAALDIMESYTELYKKGLIKEEEQDFTPIKVVYRKNKIFIETEGEEFPITDKRVKVIFPSMGEAQTRALNSAFRTLGINSKEMPIPTMETLKIGRANTTCKECLPLILTTGTMIEYFNNRPEDEITLFFMPHGAGPCRQGQYHIFQENLINKLKIKNAAIITSTDEKSYNEFGNKFLIIAWIAIIASECFEECKSVLKVLAEDKINSLKIYNAEFENFLKSIETGNINLIFKQIKETSEVFSKIKLKTSLNDAKIISLVGEVYVRREEFSRLNLIEILEKNDFVVIPTPASEYVYYCNYLAKKGIRKTLTTYHRIKTYIANFIENFIEKRIKKEFIKTGLIHYNPVDIKKTINHSNHLISEDLLGEAILTVGSSLREIIDSSCVVISIGPFGCMPSRVAESILNKVMNKNGKETASKKQLNLKINNLPFLAIETDGNIFPPLLLSKIEIFILQANRLHEILQKEKH